MSKYYKDEDLQRALIGFVRETGIDELPYEYAGNVLDRLSALSFVRCGECKYNETGHCPMAWWDDSLQELLNYCTADDFCSKGKRKDE